MEKEEEEDINELISLGEEKQLLEFIFLDETQKEVFPLSININKNDTFSIIIDKFYEKKPEYKEKKLKIFQLMKI